MIYYRYDENGYYLGHTGKAQENPRRKGDFPLPFRSTFDQPPISPSGQIPKRTGQTWVLVPDLRGTKYWLNGTPRTWEEIEGPLPDGHQLTDPALDPLTLEQAKILAFKILAETRYNVEIGGITLNGQPFPSDRRTADIFDTAYLKAQNDPAYTIRSLKTAPGQFRSMSASEILQVGEALEEHVQLCFENEEAISDLINAATTVAEVENVDLTVGWP